MGLVVAVVAAADGALGEGTELGLPGGRCDTVLGTGVQPVAGRWIHHVAFCIISNLGNKLEGNTGGHAF